MAYVSIFFHKSLPDHPAVIFVCEALTHMIVEICWIWGLVGLVETQGAWYVIDNNLFSQLGYPYEQYLYNDDEEFYENSDRDGDGFNIDVDDNLFHRPEQRKGDRE